jgi:hypothetical protein
MTYTSQVNKKSPVFMRFFRVLSGRMGVRGSRRARRMTSDRQISPDFTLLCGLGVIGDETVFTEEQGARAFQDFQKGE